jgi:hypothetical protein
MEEINETKTGLAEAGKKLLAHSKAAQFTAKRGLVVELFPFIFGASERMSAKAISQFLEKEQEINLSSVTINKALKDPTKNWNLFFDLIESAARDWERSEGVRMKNFLFEKKYLPEPIKNKFLNKTLKKILPTEWVNAVVTLREKWFSIDYEIRLKARPYIEHRLEK